MIKRIRSFHEKERPVLGAIDYLLICLVGFTTIITLSLMCGIAFSPALLVLSLLSSALLNIPLRHRFGIDGHARLGMAYSTVVVSLIIILVFL
jgi:hypothetical protein